MSFDPSALATPYFLVPTAFSVALAALNLKQWKAGRSDRVELAEYRKYATSLQLLRQEVEKESALKSALSRQLAHLKSQVNGYTQSLLLSRVGLYNPLYTLPDCPSYKQELLGVREAQKALVKGLGAISFFSAEGGQKHNLAITRLALRTFNLECDFLMAKVDSTNYGDAVRRVQKAYDTVNATCEPLGVAISLEYLQLKNKEVQLTFEYKSMVAQEQDEARAERLRVRQEERDARAAAEELENANKEVRAAEENLRKAELKAGAENQSSDSVIMREIQSLRELVKGGHERRDRAASMAEQTKAGYVYIISNVGSFGENMFKVGMTRRLNPMNRVIELGDAAVPFTFDVHAFIFSEDAPALEHSLHTELRRFAVNKVNAKKEFFYTDLGTIEAAVRKYHGDFKVNRTPVALEYRQSLALAYPDQYPMPSDIAPELDFIEFYPKNSNCYNQPSPSAFSVQL